MMVNRKEEHFSNINTWVVKYDLFRRGDDVHLTVATTEMKLRS
jgi:hypothetical protein